MIARLLRIYRTKSIGAPWIPRASVRVDLRLHRFAPLLELPSPMGGGCRAYDYHVERPILDVCTVSIGASLALALPREAMSIGELTLGFALQTSALSRWAGTRKDFIKCRTIFSKVRDP